MRSSQERKAQTNQPRKCRSDAIILNSGRLAEPLQRVLILRDGLRGFACVVFRVLRDGVSGPASTFQFPVCTCPGPKEQFDGGHFTDAASQCTTTLAGFCSYSRKNPKLISSPVHVPRKMLRMKWRRRSSELWRPWIRRRRTRTRRKRTSSSGGRGMGRLPPLPLILHSVRTYRTRKRVDGANVGVGEAPSLDCYRDRSTELTRKSHGE